MHLPDSRRALVRVTVLTTVLGVACSFLFTRAAGAAGNQSALNPKGPVASTIAHLWWVLFAVSLLVVVAVTTVLVVGALRKSARDGELERPGRIDDSDNRIIALGGIVVPAAILIAIFAYSLRDLRSLAEPEHPAAFTIQVIAHQWWWEVRYPDQSVVTANEIHIPAGEPIELELTSTDVIHSFWVPNLVSKRDLIPGHTNKLWMQADTAGTYRGECAEFCGTEHALMAFLVIAQPAADFNTWLSGQQADAPEPADDVTVAGQQAFLGSACVYCHTVRGTAASGKVGPDLTHVASRQTLAAGTIENDPGNLAHWINDPQSVKPGNHMPNSELAPDDFQALLAYLETLK